VYGASTLTKAWRRGRMVLSACLRPVTDNTFEYHLLGIELSPRAGGPPG
jgi:hypothetical protein